ncbi:phosphopantetheine-binding protein, partial [Streptomyces sp. NPDC059152]|uniref:acyl carrier protein n=1 Tax=Streptomyces sp. NPDC059152 TaxID=3346742 RepID=UPI0036B0D52D
VQAPPPLQSECFGRPGERAAAAGQGVLSRLGDIVAATLKLDEPADPERLLSDYGFDSLSGMKIAAAIEEELGLRVRLGDLLQHPTLRDVADHLAGLIGDGPDGGLDDVPGAGQTPAPQPRAEAAAFPLSAGQRALSVIERTAPGNYAYNLPLAFWLAPDTDEAALRAALRSRGGRRPPPAPPGGGGQP